MQFGQLIGEPPVHLLGEGGVAVVGAQTGFDVADSDLLIVRRKGGCETSGGIALNQHQVRRSLGEDLLKLGECPRGDLRQGLLGRHDVQVNVREHVENPQHLVQHLTVLASDDDLNIEAVAALAQFLVDRGEFHRFRASSEYQRYLQGDHLDHNQRAARHSMPENA